jgi:hypothetical protein
MGMGYLSFVICPSSFVCQAGAQPQALAQAYTQATPMLQECF